MLHPFWLPSVLSIHHVDPVPSFSPTWSHLQFPYLCAVVSESLRIFPPGASVSREVGDTPLELGGYTIPAHSPIFVATYSLHHSNEYWPRAGEFLPERWLPVSRGGKGGRVGLRA